MEWFQWIAQVQNEETSIMMLFHMPHNAIYAIHTMPFMQENTIFGQLMADPQLGQVRLHRMPILPSQCHLCNMRMPFMQPMPIVQIRKCHLCTQCQLCAQCHLCMLHNTKYASGAQVALLHIWHCEWHCVMSYYAREVQQYSTFITKKLNLTLHDFQGGAYRREQLGYC